MENQEPLEEAELVEQSIVKPKRKQTLTDEQRAKKAEHMRKISLARIEKHRLANESKLEEAEDKLVEKLAKVEDKKKQVRKIKEEKPIDTPVDTPVRTARKAPAKKTTKIVYETSDSDEYDNDEDGETTGESDDEEEVIYVAKKPRKSKSSKSLVKPKKQIREKDPIEIEIPKPVIKFL